MARMQIAMGKDLGRERFAALLREHQGILFKAANAYCRNAADREDLAQEIRVQLWRAFPSYDDQRPFSMWMYRIALNVAISFARRRAILIFSLLLWTPLAIVWAKGWYGADLYRICGPLWIAQNLAFGLLAIPVLLYLTRRFERSLGTIGDDLAGRKLAAAMGFLDEIERFERE